MKYGMFAAAVCAAPIAFAQPVLAKSPPGDPVKISDDLTIDPIIEGRLRFEHVDQPATDADALTLRLRAGAELRMNRLSLLAEAEATLGLIDDYNAFPFAAAGNQRRPRYSVIADPMTIEVNRLQLQYKGNDATFTFGRQRINIDDQRWVGSVGWRQNEQTFDAARGEAKFGPVAVDATYALSQRTVFGVDAGPRQAYRGNFFFAGAGAKAGPIDLKGFAYLLDYDRKESFFLGNSSKTFGVRATGAFPIARGARLNVTASYARQSDWKDNPLDYAADYVAGELGATFSGLGLTAGYEKLGADKGSAVQTPMATLHKFNGWADVFLTTPATGLQDYYGGISYNFGKVKAVKGLNAAITFHRFESDAGGVHYGNEWDAQLGFALARFAILAKYADYDAKRFGADTRKFWLQAEFRY